MAASFDIETARAETKRIWRADIFNDLCQYIRIPCLSPGFDENWKESGHLDAALNLLMEWCNSEATFFYGGGLYLERIELPGHTPILLIEIPAYGDNPPPGTVLLYGHWDKQPEMTGWDQGLSAWEPVLRGDRLYGRGGADDGYAIFSAITSLRLLQEQRVPHARCVILIEASEESGSPHLPAYLEHLKERIGTPDLVICLDSSCVDYGHLCHTDSLRGVVMGNLRVQILTEGVHSGTAGGIVPSSFRIARQLLDRIENTVTGELKLPEFYDQIRHESMQQLMALVKVSGKGFLDELPWVEGAQSHLEYPPDIYLLKRNWHPSLEIIGVDGIPPFKQAGNVLRPYTDLMLSMRLPPTVDPDVAAAALKRALEENPPNGAKVTFTSKVNASGWAAPRLAPWLEESLKQASQTVFGKPLLIQGEGGTIPFMAMLGKKFPNAQFFVTGVLGPESHAHGPNEFLHVPTFINVTVCTAKVIADHARR